MNIFMNGVLVGEISNEKYESIKKETLKDKRLWVLQLCNVSYSLFVRFSDMLLRDLPILMFWLFVSASAFMSDKSKTVISLLNDVTIHQMLLAINYILMMWIPVYVFLRFAYTGAFSLPGFENKFGLEIKRKVREHANVSADGTLTLTDSL